MLKALDLFCGAGGATKGLQRAGFHVTGVDIKAQARYCGDEFHQADALTFPLEGFDFIWASPPCQAYAPIARVRLRQGRQYPDLVGPVRERLLCSGLPFVIENVQNAPLQPHTICLCGLMFALPLLRHRFFESRLALLAPPHRRHTLGMGIRGEIFTVVGKGSGGNIRSGRNPLNAKRTPVKRASLAQAKLAMGIEWMTLYEMCEAIPPAYSEFIGRQVVEVLRRADGQDQD